MGLFDCRYVMKRDEVRYFVGIAFQGSQRRVTSDDLLKTSEHFLHNTSLNTTKQVSPIFFPFHFLLLLSPRSILPSFSIYRGSEKPISLFFLGTSDDSGSETGVGEKTGQLVRQ